MTYSGLTFDTYTACGTRLLVGFLCRPNSVRACQQDLQRLSHITFSKKDDIYDIDYRLAHCLATIDNHDLWAVGVSAILPNIPLATGGVIGAPHLPPQSAIGVIEPIGNGLTLQAHPGSHGTITSADGKTHLTVTDGSGPQATGSITLSLHGILSTLT